MNAVIETVRPAVDVHSATAARSALKTFFAIAERWELTSAESMKLLDVGRSRYYEWRAGDVKGLDHGQLERLSYVFGIYKALHVLFPVAERADAWVRKPNAAPLFGGRSALDRMLAGNVADLFVVRQYLDAQRGGWA